MPILLLCLFPLVRLLCSGQQSIAIENAALRLQLRAVQRTRRRPVLTTSDRLFWGALARIWSDWREALMIVQPETRWQCERFRRFWTRLSNAEGALRFGRDTSTHFADGERESALARTTDSVLRFNVTDHPMLLKNR
jgi:hypothetical protein